MSEDRLGELEMLSRVRMLTSAESDELARIVRNERRRTWYRKNRETILARLRHRYATDEEWRQKELSRRVDLFRRKRGA